MAHDGGSALFRAAMDGKLRIVQLLVSHGANVNLQSDGEENSTMATPLHMAVRKSILAVVSFLLSLPACNPNIKDRNGERPIHFAVAPAENSNFFESEEVLKLLLAHPKIDPNGSDDNGDDR